METAIIDDFEGVVEDVRLALREEQVQWAGMKGIGDENRFLAALALMGEVLSGRRQLELGGNQEAGSITEAAVLGINETGQIRYLYRAIFEIPEKPNEIELRTKKEMVNGWKDLAEIREVNSADQIGQLNALRFEMQSGKFNLPRAKSDQISGNEMPGMRKGIPKGGNLQQIWGRC